MYKLFWRFAYSLIGTVLLFVGGTFIAAPPVAHAAPTVDLSCTGTSTLHYSPGLTSKSQSITITEQGVLDTCLVSSDPTIPSGKYTSSGTGSIACVFSSILNRNTLYHWKNGKSSAITYVTSVTTNYASVSTITDTGVIASGEYSGDRVMQTSTFIPNMQPACSSNGNILSSTLQLTVTHP